MTPQLIDSHAHLDVPKFDADRATVLQDARQAGVSEIITIGTDPDTSRAARELACHTHGSEKPTLFATGVHPHEAAKVVADDWGELQALWTAERVVAVGEIGLDYYYDFSPRKTQREVFVRQLQSAADSELPVVIHVRDAFDDFFDLYRPLDAGGVLHCFTGGPAEAERALDLGLMISFSGIVTFPKAESLRDAATLVPGDRLLVETDAPYLAPVPYRGKRNEPAYVAHTARRLAEVRGEPYEAICASTRANAISLFRLPV